MALVTVQRSPSPSGTGETEEADGKTAETEESSKSLKSPRQRSENYFTVKGAALILPQSDYNTAYSRKVTKGHGGDIQNHLQAMFSILRPQDTIKVAVKLEGSDTHYLVVVSCIGRQDTEESVILGMDLREEPVIGLIVPIWAHTDIKLDGDGGFSITLDRRVHTFKPVSVQAMWSALQSLNKVVKISNDNLYIPNGLTHTWVGYYESKLSRENNIVAYWSNRSDIDLSYRTQVDSFNSEEQTLLMRIKTELKYIMMNVDLEEVTCRYVRNALEDVLKMDLLSYRSVIDTQMFEVLGQMDAPSKILDYLYLGSEWNASNLEELQQNGVNYILNISREIDNFFPGILHYFNVKEWDVESTDLLRHWEDTHKFINKARKRGSKTLVHCKMGISRSASTVMAYLMKENQWSRQKAFDFVKDKRSIVNPNAGFWKQLETYEGILKARYTYPDRIVKSKHQGTFQDDRKEKEGEEGDSAFILTPEEMMAMKTGQASTAGEQFPHMEADLEVGSRSDSTEESHPDETSSSQDVGSGSGRHHLHSTSSHTSGTESYSTDSEDLSEDEQDNLTGFTPIDVPSLELSGTTGEDQCDIIRVKCQRSDSDPEKTLLDVDLKETRCSREGSVSKFKPDGSWIKDTEDEQDEIKEETSEEKSESVEVKTEKQFEQQVKASGNEEKYRKVEDDSSKLEENILESSSAIASVLESCSKEERPVNEFSSATVSKHEDQPLEPGVQHHYAKENIPWSPGMVKKQKLDLEERSKPSTHKKSDSENSADLQNVMDTASHYVEPSVNVDKGREMIQTDSDLADAELAGITEPSLNADNKNVSREQDSELEASTQQQRSSVYDLEDIQVTPGTVKRTTQEIEERNKLSSTTPRKIQRSSSLKTRRVTPKAKDRESERRKTCIALLSPTSTESTSNVKSENTGERNVFADETSQSKEEEEAVAVQTAEDDVTGTVKVYKFLGEEVTVQQGLVRRQTLDIESKAQEVIVTKPTKHDFSLEQKSNLIDMTSCDLKAHSQVDSKPVPDYQHVNQVDSFQQVESSPNADATQDLVYNSGPKIDSSPHHVTDTNISIKTIAATLQEREQKGVSDVTQHFPDSVTPVSSKKRGIKKQESRLDEETLVLIREIGSALLNSPAKTEIEEDTDAPLEGGSLVSHYVRNIERQLMKGTKKPLKEILIIDKDTQEKKHQRLGVITSASKPQVCDKSIESDIVHDTMSANQADSTAAKRLFSEPPGDKLALNIGQRSCDPALLSLNLATGDSNLEKSDMKPSECMSSPTTSESEPCSVKNLVGKFEKTDGTSKSTASTPVSGNILSPSSMFSPFSADEKVIEVIDKSPPSDKFPHQEKVKIECSGDRVPGVTGPRLGHRQSEPVIKLSEKSMALFEEKLKEEGGPVLSKLPSSVAEVDNESCTPSFLRSKSGSSISSTRPKSAEHKHLKTSRSFQVQNTKAKNHLRPSRTLPESETIQPAAFTWEGKKVRKLYGKSHPLAKLEERSFMESSRSNPFYNTM